MRVKPLIPLILLILAISGMASHPTVKAEENSLVGQTYWTLYNMTIHATGQGMTFDFYIVYNETMEFGNDTVTVTEEVVDTNSPFFQQATPTTRTYSYDDYLSEIATNPEEGLGMGEMGGGGQGAATINYEGQKSWNGYPALKYSFSYSGENGTMRGEIYIHAGLGVPLYIDMQVNSNEGNASVKLELKESNLPKQADAAVYDAGNYRITVVAPEEAEIQLQGNEGDNTLTVSNTGTAPGWVLVEKTSASMQGAASSSNVVASVAVMPGETKTINLPTPIQASITEVSGGGGGGYVAWIVIIVILAIIGGIAYKIFSKPKTTEMLETETPQPETTW